MSRRGTLRGMFGGFLGLVALHALGSQGGSGRIAEAFADVSGLIERVLDPDVPAIPDLRGPAIDPNSPGAKAAASVAKAKAAGGAAGGISDRLTGRLPIPEPVK